MTHNSDSRDRMKQENREMIKILSHRGARFNLAVRQNTEQAFRLALAHADSPKDEPSPQP
jgi:hypothetical protein